MNDPDEGSTTSEGEMLLDVLNDDFGEDSWLWRRYAIAHIGCFVGTTRGEGGAVGYGVIDVGDDLLFWRLYGDQCRGVSLTMPPHVCGPLLGTSVVQKVTYRDEPPMPTNRGDVVGVLRELDRLRHQGLETVSVARNATGRDSAARPAVRQAVLAQAFTLRDGKGVPSDRICGKERKMMWRQVRRSCGVEARYGAVWSGPGFRFRNLTGKGYLRRTARSLSDLTFRAPITSGKSWWGC